ncbi:MAG TPA: class I SAM-dependent methyltransferase [Methanothrix sp.]
MTVPDRYSFARYLEAKKGIDDRSLNGRVWNKLAERLKRLTPDEPIRILEVGAGIGTMIERMLDKGLLDSAIYIAIDVIEENKIRARERMRAWAANHCMIYEEHSMDKWEISGRNMRIEIGFKNEDFFDFASSEKGKFDLIIANAFLDLVDIQATLPVMAGLLEKGGLFYFTINFDGLTVLEPAIDEEMDDLILHQYHKSMDERLINGRRSGDSRAGRHLFSCLKEAGMQILDAGSSDWVIFAGPDGYRQDEIYFLHFIINSIGQALQDCSELDSGRLNDWISERHNQVENNELIYIAHQIDFVGSLAEPDLPFIDSNYEAARLNRAVRDRTID